MRVPTLATSCAARSAQRRPWHHGSVAGCNSARPVMAIQIRNDDLHCAALGRDTRTQIVVQLDGAGGDAYPRNCYDVDGDAGVMNPLVDGLFTFQVATGADATGGCQQRLRSSCRAIPPRKYGFMLSAAGYVIPSLTPEPVVAARCASRGTRPPKIARCPQLILSP